MRLWKEIQGLEAKCLAKDSEISAGTARAAELEAKHRLPGTNRAADADAWGTDHGEFFIAEARRGGDAELL